MRDPQTPEPPSTELDSARNILQVAKALGLGAVLLLGGALAVLGPGDTDLGGGFHLQAGTSRDHASQTAIRVGGSGVSVGRHGSRQLGAQVAQTVVSGAFEGIFEQYLWMAGAAVLLVGGFLALK